MCMSIVNFFVAVYSYLTIRTLKAVLQAWVHALVAVKALKYETKFCYVNNHDKVT